MHGRIQFDGRIGNVGFEPFGEFPVLRADRGRVQFGRAVHPQSLVGFGHMVANPLLKICGEHVGHAQAAPGGFVGIGRANATAGGADIILAAGGFKGFIQRLMGGGDEMGGIRDAQALRGSGDARLTKHVHFFKQGARVDHHAIAQHSRYLRVDDTRREQVQFKNVRPHRNSVTGIIAAVIAGADVCMGCEPVDNTAFSLVPPLCTNNDL